MKMSEHQCDKRILESCVDPNPLMVERQDPDNFTLFQARERCALEIAAYVFKKYLLQKVGNMAICSSKSNELKNINSIGCRRGTLPS